MKPVVKKSELGVDTILPKADPEEIAKDEIEYAKFRTLILIVILLIVLIVLLILN